VKETSEKGPVQESEGLTQCAMCSHFKFYHNEKGHTSPHALGRCRAESWDGNMGQWPMFQHPCKNFTQKQPKE
jgi:hypothetical protein